MVSREKIRKLLRILCRHAWRRGLFFRVAASVEHTDALAGLQPEVVVDIGANKGQFALFCVGFFANVRVISFEPLAEPAARFRALFRRFPQITMHETAIGTQRRTTTIYISRRDDASSLLPITERLEVIFPGAGLDRQATVRVSRLADFVDASDLRGRALLKLDVQGYELEALKGCSELLSSFEVIYVECSYVELYQGQALAGEVACYLAEQGFRQVGIFNESFDPAEGPVQADFLFVASDGALRESVRTGLSRHCGSNSV